MNKLSAFVKDELSAFQDDGSCRKMRKDAIPILWRFMGPPEVQ